VERPVPDTKKGPKWAIADDMPGWEMNETPRGGSDRPGRNEKTLRTSTIDRVRQLVMEKRTDQLTSREKKPRTDERRPAQNNCTFRGL